MKKKITVLICSCISVLVIVGGLYAYQKKKDEQAALARYEKVNSAIMEMIQPIAEQYELTDMKVDPSRTDFSYFESHNECQHYYFISQKYTDLSNETKLDILEALYGQLIPEYTFKKGVYISDGTKEYTLFVEEDGTAGVGEKNLSDMIFTNLYNRESEYAARYAKTTAGGSSSSSKEKVICTMCNGTGQVKYYYGDGDDDYEFGPCTSCDEKGYVYIETHGEGRVTCPSCGNKVDNLVTRKDNAGVSRTWCSSCWSEYDDIMGN